MNSISSKRCACLLFHLLLLTLHYIGTYTNQWMVLDMKRFTPGRKPVKDDGLLIILEEIPGLIHWEDLSHVLGHSGYWASYNNAYFDDIRAISGANDACKFDESYCYNLDPRAQLFSKLQWKVNDVSDMQKLMGYNRWKQDKISDSDSCNVSA